MSLDIQSGLMQERSAYSGPNGKFRFYSSMLRCKIRLLSHGGQNVLSCNRLRD
ncbi:hypothetical protein [Xanthomonas nasturtii]|uniref:Uncharacterized protein n=1 Tax=Xanthomonas nasturtii TaxID=1843581 RepID=A0ABT0LTX6_9XANT|nr:hypothetical protein [Xanthomonas nasturtii]MCL1535991.1 hypothetical protein [Xanthomonas nasturtii]MCL1552761.1 hypothetical protein [Xanthomonas nasturtii]MCL1570636.1 hypothetical protein [Xanthomonas nasturtii]